MSVPKLLSIRTSVFTLVICTMLTTQGLAQNTGGAVLPSERTLNHLGLEMAWWNHATMHPSRDRIKSFTADEEISYVQSRTGMVTAFDNANGRKLWSVKLGLSDSISFPLVSNEDLAIVASGSTLYALNRWNGETAWETPLPNIPSASPAVDAKHVYVGGVDGSVVSLDLQKLTQYHRENLLPRYANLAVKWRYKTGSEISTPAITNGTVVDVAARDGSLYGLSAGEHQIRFQFETDAPISAPLAYSAGNLFLASEDFNIYCIDANNGSIRWEFVSGEPIRKAAQVVGKQVYLMPEKGGIFCLDVANGLEIWSNRSATDFLAATSSVVYTSDNLGTIHVLSRKDGAVLGSLPLRNFDIRIANDRTDRLFLANESGLVLCLREQNRPFPLYHKHPERQPILPQISPEEAPAAAKTPGDGDQKLEAPADGKK